MKFTKEIKENWLKALKSGDYTQGTGCLLSDGKHCCIGVLCDILPNMSIHENGEWIDGDSDVGYESLVPMINGQIMGNLATKNDTTIDFAKRDYSNVIPMIEALETKD